MLQVSALGICPAFIKTRGVATQTNLHGQRVITGKSLSSSNCKHHIFTPTSDVSEEFMSFPTRLTLACINHSCFLPASAAFNLKDELSCSNLAIVAFKSQFAPRASLCFSPTFSADHLFQIVQILKGLVLWIWRDSTSSKQEDRKCY